MTEVKPAKTGDPYAIMPKSARVSAYPGFVPFCDPTLSDHAPSGDGWAHEIKADGYRAQVHVIDGG